MQEPSPQVPVQQHSRREPAGIALWNRCNVKATGTCDTSEKEGLGTKAVLSKGATYFLR